MPLTDNQQFRLGTKWTQLCCLTGASIRRVAQRDIVTEDTTTSQHNRTDTYADQPISPSDIRLTNIDDFVYWFDHAVLESNTTRWTNTLERISLPHLTSEETLQPALHISANLKIW